MSIVFKRWRWIIWVPIMLVIWQLPRPRTLLRRALAFIGRRFRR